MVDTWHFSHFCRRQSSSCSFIKQWDSETVVGVVWLVCGIRSNGILGILKSGNRIVPSGKAPKRFLLFKIFLCFKCLHILSVSWDSLYYRKVQGVARNWVCRVRSKLDISHVTRCTLSLHASRSRSVEAQICTIQVHCITTRRLVVSKECMLCALKTLVSSSRRCFEKSFSMKHLINHPCSLSVDWSRN